VKGPRRDWLLVAGGILAFVAAACLIGAVLSFVFPVP